MISPAALLLAAAAAACGDPAVAQPEACERLLRTARVGSKQKLAEGITGSERVELQAGPTRVRAVFKTVDSTIEGEESLGSEIVTAWRDSWKHEVAAYELDKLLGLRLVPTVVERKLGGKRGSLQLWVERSLARFGLGPVPPEPRTAEDGMHAARMLDYLIYNRDRHVRNLLFGADWRPIAIDNSMSFQAFARPFRPLYRFPRGAALQLDGLDAGALRTALGRYLARDEMAGLVKRCDHLRAMIKALRAERGDEKTLFDW